MKNIGSILKTQRNFFDSGKTQSYSFRYEALESLRLGISKFESELIDACRTDLGKCVFETYATETGFVREEIRHLQKNLRSWMRPKRSFASVAHFLAHTKLERRPYGNALIMSPWNYPVQLALAPLAGAIAGGNTALLKPSEYTPNVNQVLTTLLSGLFPAEYIDVIEGGVAESQACLLEPWDKIFFTGSIPVGKLVMAAAAKHLSSVTLELGGKSPVFLDETIDLELAARRIWWGKCVNAGQTCVAPDYVLLPSKHVEEFLRLSQKVLREFYGESVIDSPDFARINNDRHWERLTSYLSQGEIMLGGSSARKQKFIEPTALMNISPEAPVMQEEIFGPILPIISYENIEDCFPWVRSLGRPLSLYVFSESSQFIDKIHRSFEFGGGCINDTLIHLACDQLPFGGVGSSGLGNYHGRASFEAFTYPRGLVNKTTAFDVPVRYPPYASWKESILRLLMN